MKLLVAAGLIAIGVMFPTHAQAIPACQYEDGNPNGQPCLWTDPDTGRLYYNDSSNYHR